MIIWPYFEGSFVSFRNRVFLWLQSATRQIWFSWQSRCYNPSRTATMWLTHSLIFSELNCGSCILKGHNDRTNRPCIRDWPAKSTICLFTIIYYSKKLLQIITNYILPLLTTYFHGNKNNVEKTFQSKIISGALVVVVFWKESNVLSPANTHTFRTHVHDLLAT